MERKLRLADGQLIEDQNKINELLDEEASIAGQRENTPPPVVLKGFELSRAKLSPRERVLVGNLESPYGRREGFIEEAGEMGKPLFEIADLTIDLTPEAEERSPKKELAFQLSDGGQSIAIDVLLVESFGEYGKYRGNESELEKIVSTNLMTLLRDAEEKNWEIDWLGAWSVVK